MWMNRITIEESNTKILFLLVFLDLNRLLQIVSWIVEVGTLHSLQSVHQLLPSEIEGDEFVVFGVRKHIDEMAFCEVSRYPHPSKGASIDESKINFFSFGLHSLCEQVEHQVRKRCLLEEVRL